MPENPTEQKKFLGVHFVECNVYGRFYKNKDGTAYTGRCPKCGKLYKIPIGHQGTNQRFFKAHCNTINTDRAPLFS